MNDQLLVLNALLRLARRRVPASLPELDARVGSTAARVRSALGSLAAAGLVVQRRADGTSAASPRRGQHLGEAAAQLTFEGFALAVALARQTASRAGRRASARPARRAA
jgi:DNA-binding GntR family transcriptional regulator